MNISSQIPSLGALNLAANVGWEGAAATSVPGVFNKFYQKFGGNYEREIFAQKLEFLLSLMLLNRNFLKENRL